MFASNTLQHVYENKHDTLCHNHYVLNNKVENRTQNRLSECK